MEPALWLRYVARPKVRDTILVAPRPSERAHQFLHGTTVLCFGPGDCSLRATYLEF